MEVQGVTKLLVEVVLKVFMNFNLLSFILTDTLLSHTFTWLCWYISVLLILAEWSNAERPMETMINKGK